MAHPYDPGFKLQDSLKAAGWSLDEDDWLVRKIKPNEEIEAKSQQFNCNAFTCEGYVYCRDEDQAFKIDKDGGF